MGNLRFKVGKAYTGREIDVPKSIGLAYSWKDIYVSSLQNVFTETRLKDVELTKTQPCKYFAYMAISKYKPPGAYIWRGDLTEGFLASRG